MWLRFPYDRRIDPLGMPLDLTVRIGSLKAASFGISRGAWRYAGANAFWNGEVPRPVAVHA